MNLEDMAPELLRLILSEIDKPNDLTAMIKASSTCYRALKIGPKQVLITILSRVIKPDALPYALAVQHFSSGDSTNQPADLGSLAFPDDAASLMAMWRFHEEVMNFATLYTGMARAAIEAVPFSGPWCWPDLTQLEWARFQRAFYRFELYSRIVPSDPSERIKPYGTQPEENEQLRRYDCFTDTWQPWESAELLCIHRFLSQLARGHIVAFNDAFVNAAMSAHGIRDRALTTSSWRTGRSKDGMRSFQGLEFAGMRLFAADEAIADYSRNPWTSFIALRGIKFLKALPLANRDQLKHLLLVNNPPLRRFKREIREHTKRAGIPYSFANDENMFLASLSIDPNTQDDHVAGTLGSRMFPTRPFSMDEPSCDPLEEMAAPMWDADRIRLPRVRQALTVAHGVDEWEMARRCSASWGLRAEKRLEDVMVPDAEYERIKREFGVPRSSG